MHASAFTFVLQVMLLNLLIAIMSDTHSRVHHVSQLVALYERAKLVLEQEHELKLDHVTSRPAAAMAAASRAAASRAGGGAQLGKRGAPLSAWLERRRRAASALACDAQRLLFGHTPEVERATPRWLHVLMPAEQTSERDGASEEARQIRKLRDELRAMNADMHVWQQKVIDVMSATHQAVTERASHSQHQAVAERSSATARPPTREEVREELERFQASMQASLEQSVTRMSSEAP